MAENQNMEAFTGKVQEPSAPSAAPKGGKRWVKALIWALSLCLALGVGAVVGGGVVYGVMRVSDRFSIEPRLRTIRGRGTGPESVTVDIPAPGALIVEVTEGGPADLAGLEVGDVVVAVEGQELGQEGELADLIAGHKPGDRVTLEVWGGGRRDPASREVTVELGEHPEREGVAYLGVSFVPAPGFGLHWEGRPFGEFEFDGEHFDCDEPGCRGPWFREWRFREPESGEPGFEGHHMPFFHDVPFERGAIVHHVVEDSPAFDADLRTGDVITAIDGEAVEDPGALRAKVEDLEPGDEITLSVYRSEDEQELEIAVMLGEDPDDKGKAYLGVQIGGFFHMERFFEDDEGAGPFKFLRPGDESS